MELFDLNVPIRHIVRELEVAEKSIRRIKNQYLFFGSIQPYKGYMKRYGRSMKEIQEDEVAKR